MKNNKRSPWTAAAVLGLALVLGGCATTSADGQPRRSAGQRLDPWENWNRKVFSFNEELDQKILRPVATAYRDIVPVFVRGMITNFFNNIEDVWSAANHFFQGKGESGVTMTMRVATNTVLGFGGIADVATEAGLERQSEDFGQTLGHWGFGAGAYIVWPVLGPSSVRDSAALPLDLQASPASLLEDGGDAWGVRVIQLINTRARLLGASRVIDDIALDKYTFVRDAYLARRRALVSDGNGDAKSSSLDDDDPPSAGRKSEAAPAR